MIHSRMSEEQVDKALSGLDYTSVQFDQVNRVFLKKHMHKGRLALVIRVCTERGTKDFSPSLE